MIVEMKKRACGPQDYIKTRPIGAQDDDDRDVGRLQPGRRYNLAEEIAKELIAAGAAEEPTPTKPKRNTSKLK